MTRVHACWLAGGAILAAAAFLLGARWRPVADPPAQAGVAPGRHESPGPSPFVPPRRVAGSPHPGPPDVPAPVVCPHPADSPARQEWIATRIAELNGLAWYDDADSLRLILAELSNPMPEIRAAALDATIAFGSRDAIPRLAYLAARAHDPQQQQALNDAITYLKRPTLIEKLEPPVPAE